MTAPRLRLGHLYPRELSIYGDRGNIIALRHRAGLRGIEVEVAELSRGPVQLGGFDLLFLGGGQDLDQDLISSDMLQHKRDGLRAATQEGAVVLAVCGGYQLLGRHYVAASGKEIPGLGLLDLHTEAGSVRSIGNVLIDTDIGITPSTIVGFENHAGRTHLGNGLAALGRCIVGGGNNGSDGFEGAHTGNIFGTYVHGSLLPKNPHLTDHLLRLALARRHPDYVMADAEAREEMAAHESVAAFIRKHENKARR